MIFLRSTLFNIAFFIATAMICFFGLPALLMSRRHVFMVVHFFSRAIYFLEKTIIGLDYEVRGLENLPREGAYIVAAKHQSPYETLKLHLLFDDPAIVLKKELFSLPLWGKFLQHTNPIAIDRSLGKQAIRSIIEGAQRVENERRPLVIFPQGTRVFCWETPQDKPYKNGVVRMYEATSMPIVPLALNTGLFWPRGSWIKRPGKVLLRFLPPIPPGHDPDTLLKDLETMLESESTALQNESLAANKKLVAPARPEGKPDHA